MRNDSASCKAKCFDAHPIPYVKCCGLSLHLFDDSIETCFIHSAKSSLYRLNYLMLQMQNEALKQTNKLIIIKSWVAYMVLLHFILSTILVGMRDHDDGSKVDQSFESWSLPFHSDLLTKALQMVTAPSKKSWQLWLFYTHFLLESTCTISK